MFFYPALERHEDILSHIRFGDATADLKLSWGLGSDDGAGMRGKRLEDFLKSQYCKTLEIPKRMSHCR